MTVFIVWFTTFDEEELLVGLFSTREKAEKFIKGHGYEDQRSLRIEEETVQ